MKWPQNAVCFDAGLGDGYVGPLELGRTNPRFPTLVAITRTLGFTLGDLIAVYEHKLRGIDPSPASTRRSARRPKRSRTWAS